MNSVYLPVVNPAIGFSLHEEVVGRDDDSYLTEHLTRLDEENPAISTWIRKYAELTDDPEGAMFCGLLVYRLLESQAEANQMAKDIILG
jgi:hypothetical protein